MLLCFLAAQHRKRKNRMVTVSKTLELIVVGKNKMHCPSCGHSVTSALEQVQGVEYVEADWRTQKVQVNFYPGKFDFEKVKTELDLIGYQVEAL